MVAAHKNNRTSSRPEPEYISDPLNNVQQPAFQGRSKNTVSRRF